MGTGKIAQLIGLILVQPLEGPTLLVKPPNLRTMWAREFENRVRPKLRILFHYGDAGDEPFYFIVMRIILTMMTAVYFVMSFPSAVSANMDFIPDHWLFGAFIYLRIQRFMPCTV